MQYRNSLESYTYNLKNTTSGELASKLTDEDKKTIEEKTSEMITWLEENQDCDKDVYDNKQKEIEEIINPIMTKMYQQGAGAEAGAGAGAGAGIPGMNMGTGAPPTTETQQPHIDEVD